MSGGERFVFTQPLSGSGVSAVQPQTNPIPVLQGGVSKRVPIGSLFPSMQTTFENAIDLANNYRRPANIFDTNPSNWGTQSTDWARNNALSGNIASVPDGCSYNVDIFAMPLVIGPPPGCVPDQFLLLTQGINTCCRVLATEFQNVGSGPISRIPTFTTVQNNHVCGTKYFSVVDFSDVPPEFPLYLQYQYYQDAYVVVNSFVCDPQQGTQFPVPINNPAQMDLPMGMPIPPAPQGINPPVLKGGATVNVGTQPGYADLVSNVDGSYTLNIGVPCPCGTGGEVLRPYTLKRNRFNPATGQVEVYTKTVHVTSDGTYDTSDLFEELFSMMQELLVGFPKPVTTTLVYDKQAPDNEGFA